MSNILSNIEKFKKMNIELTNMKNEIDKKLLDFDKRLSAFERGENHDITTTIKKVVMESM